MRPDLCKVKGIEAVIRRIVERHDLHLQPPDRIILLIDGLSQVAAVVVRVFCRHGHGLGIGEVLDTLLRFEVVLDPEPLTFGINPHEGVTAIAIHMAIGTRRTPVRHQERYLVKRFGGKGPEIPLRVVAAHIRVGHALLRVDEILEL